MLLGLKQFRANFKLLAEPGQLLENLFGSKAKHQNVCSCLVFVVIRSKPKWCSVVLRFKLLVLKVWVKKWDMFKYWTLVKNAQFWFYSHETLWKWFPQEVIIFTKFNEDRTKNIDFLFIANFWKCLVFWPGLNLVWP